MQVHALTPSASFLRATVFLPAGQGDLAAEQLKPPVEQLCRSMIAMLDGPSGDRPAILMAVPQRRDPRPRRRNWHGRKVGHVIQIMAGVAATLWIGSGALQWAFSPIHTTLL
jgi:hypothetical protein